MIKSTIPVLSADFVRSILDYDSLTGVFHWRYRPDYPIKWNTKWAGKVAGAKSKGYVVIQIPNPISYRAHVLAWLLVWGEWRPNDIDHRNRNRSDNRIDNLRMATEEQNCCNKGMQRNNKSGVTGVWFVQQSQRWEAKISLGKRIVWRRSFVTIEEAAEARREMLPKIHGEFAAL